MDELVKEERRQQAKESHPSPSLQNRGGLL
jgi:hypothetical protein